MISNLEMLSVSSAGKEPEKERSERRRQQKKRGYYRKTLQRIERVEKCEDIVTDWGEDPNSLRWWKIAFDVLKPPPATTISQWADRVRRISSEFAAEPGDWDTSKLECMRAVMDACSPNDPCRRVILVKSTQTGGTEAAVLNLIGFTIDVNPRSILCVFPNLDLAEGFSRERLDPMIRDNLSLRERVTDAALIGKSNKVGPVRRKRYAGGFLNIVGANSTSGLSSRPVPIVIMDEVDLCIKNAGREGNPTKLLSSRATTFPDRKEVFLGSPSCSRDETGIVKMYEDSTQEEWQVLCPDPECGCYHFMIWEHMEVETATYQCPTCQHFFAQWEWQSQPGTWVIRNPGHRTRGFRINGLISPWLDWGELCDEYKTAKTAEDRGDDSLMRVFVNTKLAETHEQTGKRVEVDLYNTRREVYECHRKGVELPDGTILLTAGVDVQDSFIAYEVIAWGRGKESWGIETGEFQGDPRSPDTNVWQQLDHFVYSRIWNYTDGKPAKVRCMFVDSGGHCTQEVYKYCKQRHPRAFAIKGVKGIGTSIILGGKKRERAEGVWVIKLGIDTLKEELHARLRVEKPGPGYCHFPMSANGLPISGYTLEFFQEIMSEQRVLKYTKGGFAQFEWTKSRTDANEALDCRNYARAALEYLKVRLEQMPRDELAGNQISASDIHTIEIGTGRRISIDARTATQRIVGRQTRYGINNALSESTNRVGQSEIGTPGQDTLGRSSKSRYGATPEGGTYGAATNTSF